ncbi:hypothetical protein [Terribacillus saccharophilus]|uniref:hypothetical protein n=1 Tax=Terribacillus saccharophilus TaxID=361277 RepID=UPI0039819C68
MFPNLRAEMARSDIDGITMAQLIGVSAKTFSSKMSGKTEFNRSEMFTIKREVFPGHTVEYLFTEEESKKVAH